MYKQTLSFYFPRNKVIFHYKSFKEAPFPLKYYAHVEGTKIEYIDRGQGPVVLLVHGTQSSSLEPYHVDQLVLSVSGSSSHLVRDMARPLTRFRLRRKRSRFN